MELHERNFLVSESHFRCVLAWKQEHSFVVYNALFNLPLGHILTKVGKYFENIT